MTNIYMSLSWILQSNANLLLKQSTCTWCTKVTNFEMCAVYILL